MARLFTTGFEGQSFTVDNWSAGAVGTGTTTSQATNVRTGSQSARIRSGGATGFADVGFPGSTTIGGVLGRAYFYRAYLLFDALPLSTTSVSWSLLTGVQLISARLTSGGKLQLWKMTGTPAQIGSDSDATLTTGAWYRVELRIVIGTGATDEAILRLDGATVASTTGQSWTDSVVENFVSGWASAPGLDASVYVDDVAINDDQGASQNTWPGEGKVVLLLPTADSAVGTGWTLGTGTAPGGNAHGSVDNTPPIGVADLAALSDPKQIRNATSNANSSYDATMTTYAAAGLAAIDTVNVIIPITATGAPSGTSAKVGTVGVVSNPAITNINLAGASGAFYAGSIAGTFASGWIMSKGTTTYGSSVTVGTAPVMRITQVTSSTRVAMVCFMGMYVDYTPGILPYTNPYPPLLAQ